jgi:capsular exopolysaccharide synthesis family protein
MTEHAKDTIYSYYESESPLATELRRLYHNARTPVDGISPKSFMITSSNRGEGKSTITANLAMTIAQFPKKKVLLVDSDMRRPRIHEIFGIELGSGLRECLESTVDPISVVQDTQLPNLQILTAGSPSSTPGQLFESETLQEIMKKITFYYDVVLVDSAPVLAVSDTLFLCSVIDQVLLVVLAGVTPREVVTRARNVLQDSDARLGGVILNNASQALPYYYDTRYYSAYKK